MELIKLDINKITKDTRTQPRAVIDEHVVNEYRLDMMAGDHFPPLVVFSHNGSYYLSDGWHRIAAAEQIGLSEIECAVKPGDVREAILYSCGVNADHGKRRSNGDKRRAVNKLLKDPQWAEWSDSEIARQCKVSHPFVGKLRPKEDDTCNVTSMDRKFTHPKTGEVSTMDTSNIGKPSDPIPAPEIFTAPLQIQTDKLPKYNPMDYELFTSPVAELSKHIQPATVDAMITDPPYPKEYLQTYIDMARQAAIILKPGGILVALCGHPYVGYLIENMSKHLHYHWLGCYYMPTGHHASLPHYSVSVYWKPLLIFSNGTWPKTKTFKDTVTNDDADKRYHEWGQGISGYKRLVEMFTLPNDTVLDPFLGGGTTAIAALEAGRYFIGSDISSDEVDKTRGRLNE